MSVPEASSYPSIKGTVKIGEIKDNRVFEQSPGDPSIPSINGNIDSLSDELKVRMIGRQRNGYGMAMGDIALPDNSSIISVSRNLLEEAFSQMGYEQPATQNATYTVDASIDEFWAWFSPGFACVSFESKIRCTLQIVNENTRQSATIQGYGLNRGQIARDANWQLAYQRAFEDFLENALVELKGSGL